MRQRLASAAMWIPNVRSRILRSALGALLSSSVGVGAAHASPVLLAGTGAEKVHATDIVLAKKDGKSVLTIMPDYQGPLSSFAVVLPVPADVTPERIATLRRVYVDRVSQMSAPKFAEFWEMDPCDDSKLEQDWERDMTASDDTAFMGTMKTDPSKKVAKEMLLDMEAKTKEGEYSEKTVGSAAEIKAYLQKKGFSLPPAADKSFADYEAAGYKFLALAVDTNRVELVGGDRAQLSPIRIWTNQDVTELPTRFGLPSAAKQQELTIFTLVPDQRMQVTNYETQAVPTNLRVVPEYQETDDKTLNLKEKIGEFYAALHDRYLEKHPKTFLLEYAWASDACGNPCPNEPLMPDEILSLGGDVFEADLPQQVRHPAPPEPTEEEKAKLEALLAEKATPTEKQQAKKQWEEDRKELAARKGILERNQFVLSRLHYRYDASGMPKDVILGAGAPIEGGVALPSGEFGAADTSVKPSDVNRFQARYNGLFPNKVEVKCEDPKPHRWGKAPRSYRGLRKIWLAEDLARRNRTRIKLEEAVVTPVPDLSITGAKTVEQRVADKKAAEAQEMNGSAESEKAADCGCRSAGLPTGGAPTYLIGVATLGLLLRRRRGRC